MIALNSRPIAKGKFLFRGEDKFFVQGVTYGPFRPEAGEGICFRLQEVTEKDLTQICQAGFNILRLYHEPPGWLMDLAAKHGLLLMVTTPWRERTVFDNQTARRARRDLAEMMGRIGGHPALMGVYVDNEIPPDLARWHGTKRIEQYLDSLIQTVKERDPAALCSYANFPPTEYLAPDAVDFCSYNVYLHDTDKLNAYLARLQNLANEKPLIIGEFGMDTIRHSEQEQAELLAEHVETVFRAGLSGTMVFSWTDEWFTDGVEVEDWAFGVTRRDRSPKKSFHRLKEMWLGEGQGVPKRFPLKKTPKVSVVVCSYNGARTLRGCMESLQKLTYPDYEIIVVDDGSTDNTQEILKNFPDIQNIQQVNQGLSVARNIGIRASKGEIVAFTDSDCIADPDWLYYLVQTFQKNEGKFAAVGGPNLSPPAADSVQAAVAASPGAPRHVLLTDTEAEHIPGCNMAFYKWALELVDGFDPQFYAAGDDVDVCWRLMQAGYKIGFSPSAVVWHYRRFTIKAYLKQQRGYGRAEAMLRYKHHYYFDSFGSARWRGVIYGQPQGEGLFHRPLVYHGLFGTGMFQCLYPQPGSEWLRTLSSLEWFGLGLFIFLRSFWVESIRILPLIMLGLWMVPALAYMNRARIEKRFETVKARFIVFYLALVQPLAREWARYFVWLRLPARKKVKPRARKAHPFQSGRLAFWSDEGKDRVQLLQNIMRKLEGWKFFHDTGWDDWDLMVFANRWWRIRVKTFTEIYPHGKRLTRVECALRPRRLSFLVGILLTFVVVPIGLGWASWTGWLVVLGILFVVWIGDGFLERSALTAIIRESAEEEGFSNV